jgi:hypothetical protein
MVPESFTYKDIEGKLGITSSYSRILVSRWVAEGLVVKEESVRKKAVFFKNKNKYAKH